MTYEQLLARQPLTTQTGDLAAASAFVTALETYLLDKDAMAQLSASQQKYLYRLRSKWQARAAGDDARWMENGSRPGRPSKLGAPRKATRDKGEQDPLFISLMNKFGTPRED